MITMPQWTPKACKTLSELLNDPWMTRALLRLSPPMRPSKVASVATIQDEARLVSSDMRATAYSEKMEAHLIVTTFQNTFVKSEMVMEFAKTSSD